jgi:hypothetical protein
MLQLLKLNICVRLEHHVLKDPQLRYNVRKDSINQILNKLFVNNVQLEDIVQV